MGHTRKSTLVGALRLILVGALLGTMAAIAYAALCGVVSWAIVSAISWMNAWNVEQALALGTRFAVAGAVAGALVGMLVAIDRFVYCNIPARPSAQNERVARLPTQPAFRNGTPLLN
jgi:hypothetical protein